MDTTPPIEPVAELVKKDTTKTVTTTANTVATPDTNKAIKPVHIDGVLYVIIGVAGVVVAALASESAEKLFSLKWLFVGKTFFECLLAGASSLKMFRDKGYTDSIKDN